MSWLMQAKIAGGYLHPRFLNWTIPLWHPWQAQTQPSHTSWLMRAKGAGAHLQPGKQKPEEPCVAVYNSELSQPFQPPWHSCLVLPSTMLDMPAKPVTSSHP
eukprot:1094473-Pelagomonas_calceolata.AAC.2